MIYMESSLYATNDGVGQTTFDAVLTHRTIQCKSVSYNDDSNVVHRMCVAICVGIVGN